MIQQVNDYFSDIYFNLHPVQKINLSHQHVRILQIIHKREYVMIRDVATHLSISHNTASDHVKKMVDNGWLVKERSVEDQRKVYLTLTDDGLSLLRNHTELDKAKLKEVLGQMTPEEQEHVISALKLLSERSR